jgi:hypothetical protein
MVAASAAVRTAARYKPLMGHASLIFGWQIGSPQIGIENY